MASFQKYKTSDGYKWLYRYYKPISSSTGKRKQITKKGFHTKKQAQLDAAQVELEIAEAAAMNRKSTISSERAPQKSEKHSSIKDDKLSTLTSTKDGKLSNVTEWKVSIKGMSASAPHITLKNTITTRHQNYVIWLKPRGYPKETIVNTHDTTKVQSEKRVLPDDGSNKPSKRKQRVLSDDRSNKSNKPSKSNVPQWIAVQHTDNIKPDVAAETQIQHILNDGCERQMSWPCVIDKKEAYPNLHDNNQEWYVGNCREAEHVSITSV